MRDSRDFGSLGGIVPVGASPVPAAEEDIRRLESSIGGALPDDYRSFLREFGASTFGQIVSFSTIDRLPPHITSSGSALFGSFFGASSNGPSDANSLAWNLANYRERIPTWLLAIADDGGDNRICIATKGINRGKVYFWDAAGEMDEGERRELGEANRHQNLYLVAQSFEDFLDHLVAT